MSFLESLSRRSDGVARPLGNEAFLPKNENDTGANSTPTPGGRSFVSIVKLGK